MLKKKKMANRDYEQWLTSHKIKPTAMRLVALKTMDGFDSAFSVADIEQTLETADRSTLFRIIALFMENHLLHSIDDGSGTVKYSLCREDNLCYTEHLHVHFACTSCHRTFCIRDVHVPIVGLPSGFVLQDVNYVLKGLCVDCAKKRPDTENILETGRIVRHL